jgi:malate synthase
MEIFDRHMQGPNQLERMRDDVQVTASDLLAVPKGTITEAGVAGNVSVGLQYLAAWLGGLGCVPINHLMEDAATAEISRAQLWQWVHHPNAVQTDGRRITLEMVRDVLARELARLRAEQGETAFRNGHFESAAGLLDRLTADSHFAPFLTLLAYHEID